MHTEADNKTAQKQQQLIMEKTATQKHNETKEQYAPQRTQEESIVSTSDSTFKTKSPSIYIF